jgi:hypothetical protein
MNKDERDSWNRILARRKLECAILSEDEIEKLFDQPIDNDAVHVPPVIKGARDKLEFILRNALYISMDDNDRPDVRRRAYRNLKMLLKRLDKAIDSAKKVAPESLPQEKNTEIADLRIPTPDGNNENSSMNKAKTPEQNQKGNQDVMRDHVREQNVTMIQQPPLPKSNHLSNRERGDGHLDVERENTATNPLSRYSLNSDGSAGSFSAEPNVKKDLETVASPLAAAPATKASIKPAQHEKNTVLKSAPINRKLSIPIIPVAPQPKGDRVVKNWFTGDTGRYDGAQKSRTRTVSAVWSQEVLSEKEIGSTIERCYIWEPYWEMLNILAVAKTSSLDKIEFDLEEKGRSLARQAIDVKISLSPEHQMIIKNWGVSPPLAYKDGDIRILAAMLPAKVPKNDKFFVKKARADYHLWPKGTFFQVSNKPRKIDQRLQNNLGEWKGLCSMLDLVQHIPFSSAPAEHTVNALILDDEAYFLCISVCRYLSPQSLYDRLMTHCIQILTEAESLQIALNQVREHQVVVLDIDRNDKEEAAATSLIFKLTCPISSTLMKTPVRASQCSHFQCFDLLNFLNTNSYVSGTRWECPVCNLELVSVYDLQYCGLTKHMLRQFEGDASTLRDQIRLFSNGTWVLLPEKRRGGQLSSVSTEKRQKMEDAGVIVL